MRLDSPRTVRGRTERGHGLELRVAATRYVRARQTAGEFSPATVADVRAQLHRFADAIGPIPLERVRRRHIEKWIAGLDLAPTSLRTRLSTVRTFFAWCADRGWTVTDPMRGIRGPRCDTPPPRNLTGAEVTATLSAAPDSRARLIVLLTVQEMLRRSEVTKLTLADIDRTARVLRVMGKGSKERIVPLTDETHEAMMLYLAEHPSAQGPLIRSYLDPRSGITPGYVTKIVRDILYAAGVKQAPYDGRSTHAFRHTGANDMLDQGADVRDVQEILGHAYQSTTSRYARRRIAMGRLRDAAGGRKYSPPA